MGRRVFAVVVLFVYYCIIKPLYDYHHSKDGSGLFIFITSIKLLYLQYFEESDNELKVIRLATVHFIKV